ncbi:hypothetical protein JZU71_01635 [bacterium]|nr:hypothetical protein [bacterium]
MSQQRKENKPVVIHGVLRDEYERIGRMVEMPKGVVREKRVQGRVYPYLHFRDSDGKVKDVYIKGGDSAIAAVKDQVAQRKQRESALKQFRREQKEIERILKKK